MPTDPTPAVEALAWLVWFARKSKGTRDEVLDRALEQYPLLREFALTPQPSRPQWEDCKVCGGDHWTKDHPAAATPAQPVAETTDLRRKWAAIIHDASPVETWEQALALAAALPVTETTDLRAAARDVVVLAHPSSDLPGRYIVHGDDLARLRAALDAATPDTGSVLTEDQEQDDLDAMAPGNFV